MNLHYRMHVAGYVYSSVGTFGRPVGTGQISGRTATGFDRTGLTGPAGPVKAGRRSDRSGQIRSPVRVVRSKPVAGQTGPVKSGRRSADRSDRDLKIQIVKY
jgi:hypothetical protein